MFLNLGLYIVPPDKIEVKPWFVVAASVVRAQAQDIVRNSERTMKPNFPVLIGFRKFKEPTNFSPVAQNRSSSPTMVWGHQAPAERSQQMPPQ